MSFTTPPQPVDTSAFARKSEVPQPANSAPVAEKTSADAGAQSTRFAMEDHAHPRLSSASIVTLDASSLATVTFTRSFAAEPCAVFAAVNTGGTSQPLVVEVVSWVKTGANFTGANIKGYRGQQLPLISQVSGILTAVVTGVNGLVTALTGFNVFGGSAANARVSCVFLMPSA